MSEREFNIIFSERLRYYLKKYDMTQIELAKKLGVGSTSVYNWCNGIKTPRMDKVDAMCKIFNCKRSDLMADATEQKYTYYSDDDVREAAQFLFNNPEYRVLFDATRKVKPEDIQFVKEMLDRFNKE